MIKKDTLEQYNKIKPLLEEIGFGDIQIRINHQNRLLINCTRYSERCNDWVGVAEMFVLPYHGSLSERGLIQKVVNQWLNDEMPLAKKSLLKKIKQW